MTEILSLVIIFLLLFPNNKRREVGKIALTIVFVSAFIGLIFSNPISVEIFKLTNFLLLVVIYILLFGADIFKEKSKVAVLIILGGIIVCFTAGILMNAPENIKKGHWENILLGILYLLGSFIIAYVINIIINKIKRKK
ncbi:MAG TPA: hypothetical protein VIK72_06615 [Clostridiaceae bacterium]